MCLSAHVATVLFMAWNGVNYVHYKIRFNFPHYCLVWDSALVHWCTGAQKHKIKRLLGQFDSFNDQLNQLL